MDMAGYGRVSTNKEDQINSLDAQIKFFTEYAEKNNYKLVKTYADEGLSGTKLKNRKDFLQLLEDAKKHKFDIVVVKDVSRLARNTVDFLNSIRMLKSLNIEVLFLSSNQTVLGDSEFILTIFGALAQEESSNTSKRIKFGKKINAEMGRVPNLCYGYDKIIGDYFNLKINEKEANIVKRIFDMYVNKGYGANKISLILNEEGLKTKRNCNFTQASVGRILKNKIYTGIIINGKQEISNFLTSERKNNDESNWNVFENQDLKIIEIEIYDMAQDILSKRINDFKINKTRQNNKHIFSTLIKCEHCGYSFRQCKRTYVNTYTSWSCSGRNANGMNSCPNKTSPYEDELLIAIIDIFEEIILRQDIILSSWEKEYDKKIQSSKQNANLSDLNLQLSKIKKIKQKYIDMFNNDIINIQELKDKTNSLNNEIQSIEGNIEKLQNLYTDKEDIKEKIKEVFKTIENILKESNITNATLKSVIEKFVINKDGNMDTYIKYLGVLNLSD